MDIAALAAIPAKSVVVDGQTGDVILNPTPETLTTYKQRKTCFKASQQILQKELQYDAETIDGCQVQVYANVGSLEDLDNFQALGVEGIGLFRTEYLFFEKQSLFSSEQEQYHAYIQLIEKAGAVPIHIRVFDLGGDKNSTFFATKEKEANPVLGCRGIRFLLRHPDIFKTQLRAILRASVYGDVRILLPLISDIREIDETRKILEEVTHALSAKGIPFKQRIPLGSMIEVPSSVLICDGIAERSDFLSIGTNDLAQYTLGVDRSNPEMSDFWHPAHPSVIRMIKMVSLEAKRSHRSVLVCGEIASNPLFIPLLLGLGINHLSCSPRYIPSIKRAIRKTSLLKAFELAAKALSLHSSEEVSKVLLEAYNSMGL
jgi:phosphotransferase system enzyme I (PtsI)